MRGSEAVPVRGGEPFERGDDTIAERVGVTERTAEERREAAPEHGTQIALGPRTEHPLIQAASGLAHQREGEPLGDVLDDPPRVGPAQLPHPPSPCPPPAPGAARNA